MGTLSGTNEDTYKGGLVRGVNETTVMTATSSVTAMKKAS